MTPRQLMILGAKYRIVELLKKTKEDKEEIKSLKSFLNKGKKQLKKKVARKMTTARRKAILKNLIKARAALALKNKGRK